MLRIVRTPEGEVVFDPTGKQNGRGAYVCKNTSCLEAVKNRSRIERALSVSATQEALEKCYMNMKEYIEKVKEKEDC